MTMTKNHVINLGKIGCILIGVGLLLTINPAHSTSILRCTCCAEDSCLPWQIAHIDVDVPPGMICKQIGNQLNMCQIYCKKNGYLKADSVYGCND